MRTPALLALFAALACSEVATRSGSPGVGPRDLGPAQDATRLDTGELGDAAAGDAEVTDRGGVALDAGVMDGGSQDAAPGDARAMDATAMDAAAMDAAAMDAAAMDAAAMDAAAMDAGSGCVFGGPVPARLDPRRGIDASRIDELARCVAAEPTRAGALLDAFLAEYLTVGSGAAPWSNGNAFVLYRGNAADLTVSGSFDNWPNPGTRRFRNIPGTDLHVAEVPVPRDGRAQYKLTRRSGGNTDWFTNPLGRWVVWDGFDRRGVGEFNSELMGPDHVPTSSWIHRRELLGRDVFTQLPLAYANGGTGFGVLYVHDGNETLTRSGMQSVVDQTIATGRAAPTVVVYVALADQNQRTAEYTYGAGTSGNNYVNALADTIAPAVEAQIPTAPMPAQRGLAGASLGGLISFHGAWLRNDAFRLIGAQSASLWWDNGEMVERFRTGAVIDARIYLDSGAPGDNSDSVRAMAAVLAMRSYAHLHIEEPNAAHDWSFWAGRFDELLEFLY